MSLGFNIRPHFQAGFAALVLSLFVVAPAQSAQAETLAEACAATLKTHPALQADRAATRAAEEAVSTARSGFFPTVKLNSEVNANNVYREPSSLSLYGRTGTLSAEQMIFDGFRTAKQTDAADADRAAAEADYQTNANQVLLAAVRAYVNVLRDREMLAAAQRFLEEHKKSMVKVKDMIQHDPGKQFDMVQLQMRAAMASSYITEREGALAMSESQFAETVGHLPDALEKPKLLDDPGFASLDKAIAVAEASHPAIKAATERLRRRQFEREQASSVLMPRVDLTARYTKGWDRQALSGANDEAFAGMMASYALSTGGAQLAAIRNAELLELSTKERVNAARRDIRESLRMTWSQRQALAKTVPLAKDYLAKAGEVVQGYELQFVLGRRSVLELLLIRNEIYTSETRLIGLSYDQLLTDYALAAQMGVLRQYFSEAPTTSAPVLPPPNPGYVPPSFPTKNP